MALGMALEKSTKKGSFQAAMPSAILLIIFLDGKGLVGNTYEALEEVLRQVSIHILREVAFGKDRDPFL